MPDIPDRKEREKGLSAALLLLFQDYRSKLPDVNWSQFQEDLQSVISEHLADTYETSFSGLKESMEIDLAADGTDTGWADRYAKELSDSIADNTQRRIDDGYDEDALFGESRADTIAVTETTRAVTAGEYALLGLAMAAGAIDQYEAIWQAAGPSPCKDCVELDGQPHDVWSLVAPYGPPYHPDCYCVLQYDTGITEAWTDEAREAAALARAAKAKGHEQKTTRALSSHKPATREKQIAGDKGQREAAIKLGGEETPDNLPMDVIIKTPNKTVGVEVKTFCDQVNNKVTVHPDSKSRKDSWVRKNKAEAWTIVLDERSSFANGAHKDKYSGNRIYVAQGHASFRLGSMTPVKNWKEAKRVMRV